jgi:hypothetical protein
MSVGSIEADDSDDGLAGPRRVVTAGLGAPLDRVAAACRRKANNNHREGLCPISFRQSLR